MPGSRRLGTPWLTGFSLAEKRWAASHPAPLPAAQCCGKEHAAHSLTPVQEPPEAAGGQRQAPSPPRQVSRLFPRLGG